MMAKGAKAMDMTGKGIVVRELVDADGVLPPEAATPYAPDAVTAQYRRAVAGALEMVRFGAMLVEIGTSLTRETRNGCIQDGDTLKGWLAANCPDVNYKTAMRFKALAEGVQRSCNVPEKVPLSLAMPKNDGTAAGIPVGVDLPIPMSRLEKIQRSVWDLVEGKSARQLQFAFAADEGSAGRPKGGTSAGRRALTADERTAAARQTLEGIVSSLGALITSTQARTIPLDARRRAATALKDYATRLTEDE